MRLLFTRLQEIRVEQQTALKAGHIQSEYVIIRALLPYVLQELFHSFAVVFTQNEKLSLFTPVIRQTLGNQKSQLFVFALVLPARIVPIDFAL